jgi:hypothetical protein
LGKQMMKDYRMTESADTKLGTFKDFKMKYTGLSKLGTVANIASTGLEIGSNYKEMQTGDIGAGKFTWRTAGSFAKYGAATYGATISMGAGLGLPIAVGAYFKGVEQIADMFGEVLRHGQIYLDNMQNNMINGNGMQFGR